jgi:hypothetical protein
MLDLQLTDTADFKVVPVGEPANAAVIELVGDHVLLTFVSPVITTTATHRPRRWPVAKHAKLVSSSRVSAGRPCNRSKRETRYEHHPTN